MQASINALSVLLNVKLVSLMNSLAHLATKEAYTLISLDKTVILNVLQTLVFPQDSIVKSVMSLAKLVRKQLRHAPLAILT